MLNFLPSLKYAVLSTAVTTGIAFSFSPVMAVNTANKAVDTTSQSKTVAAPVAPANTEDNKSVVLPDVVATVNGQPISKADLEKVTVALLSLNNRKIEDLSNEEKRKFYKAVTEELVTDRLVTDKAKSIQVSPDDVNKQLEALKGTLSQDQFDQELKRNGQTLDELKKNIEASIRQQRWIESQIGKSVQVTDADIEKYYKDHPTEFKEADKVKASHILIQVPKDAKPEVVQEKEKLAETVYEKAKKGDNFADLAKQYSEDPGSKEKGGDLGLFDKEQMVPEFANAAFAMKKDEISKPVHTNFGWHIIKVTDIQPAHQAALDEVKGDIKTFLENNKKREAITQLLQKLRSEAKVQVNIS